MSYIKLNRSFKDRERGLKFNVLAIRQFLSKLDIENYGSTANYAMVWAGLYANAYVKGEEIDFTFEEVCDFVDTLDQSTIDEISVVMAGVEAYKKLLPEPEAITDEPGTDQKKSPLEKP